ncbi:hypothetical protein [Agromyces sp. NPDC055661]
MTNTAHTTRTRTFERVATVDDAERLALRILDAARTRPLVVVTTVHGANSAAEAASAPLDPRELVAEIGDIADLVLLPTGEYSMRLADQLPDMLQVYGGAGRSYPVGLVHDPDWRRSPLRFPGANPARAIAQLISDTMSHAHTAGLFDHAPPRSRIVSGEVRGFLAGGTRALVELDDGGRATVWAELTAPPTPLDWTLAEGGRITGTLDEDAGRLSVDVLDVDVAGLAEAFPHGTVTLALVTTVADEHAELALHPAHRTRVHRMDVSPNPLDRVDLLLSEGEVVAARVVHLSTGALHLRLSDVDDGEPVVPPLALVHGGAPWLREDRPMPRAAPEEVQDAEAELGPTVAHGEVAGVPDTDATDGATNSLADPDGFTSGSPPVRAGSSLPAHAIPGPGLRRAVPTPHLTPSSPNASTQVIPQAAATAGSALRSTQLQLEAERARRSAAERRLTEAALTDSDLDRLRTASAIDRQRAKELLLENADLRREVEILRRDRSDSSRRLRDYARGHATERPATSRPIADRRSDFIDVEAWVRHEVRCAWVERVPACDKADYPLPDYAVGPDFADSLQALDTEKFAKAVKAVVDVLTGRAERLGSRELHRLRVSDAGGSPYRVREDGSYAVRCAIERNTASARRLHYWVLPSGGIELSRIDVHDVTRA